MGKTANTEGLTAKEALDPEKIQRFIESKEAEIFLRTIRSSPSFWALKKSELFAMIRQLGCPTFFMTLSAAEYNWFELIAILATVADTSGKIFTIEEAKEIPRNERFTLISNDPVTTARYFENRMSLILKYLYTDKEGGPFGAYPVIEYFWRVEFQTRGSPHVHMMTWNKNTPMYIERDNPNISEDEFAENRRELAKFADKFITCYRPQDNLVDERYLIEKNKGLPTDHSSQESRSQENNQSDESTANSQNDCQQEDLTLKNCSIRWPTVLTMKEKNFKSTFANTDFQNQSSKRLYCWSLCHKK